MYPGIEGKIAIVTGAAQSMRVFGFGIPKLVMGCGARRRLPELVRPFGRTVCIVADPAVASLPAVEQIVGEMQAEGVKISMFIGIPPDPPTQVVDECVSCARDVGADVMVAVGGGSSLDVAKCAAIMLRHNCSIESMFGIDKTPGRGVPTILVPTTAGTGSEVTPIAVLSDEEKNLKRGVVSDHLVADVALIDPELCVTLLPGPTAYTGMDTLTHAIEAYTNRFAVPLIDCFALDAIRLVAQNIRKCVEDGSDVAARYEMSVASLLGGLCLSSVNTAAVHALAYPPWR